MSKSLGSLTLDLIAKTGNFTGPLDQAARKAKRSGKDIADAADDANHSWAKLAPVIKGALAGISIGAIATSFIGNTKRMEQEQAQLAAVLKSTGHAAGFTRDELNGMADVMEGATTFSAGEINQAQTNLLAFSGVVGDQFKRAMQSVIDMSARTGMAVTASAETIGRALDIPTAGLGALSKQGFRFTDDQKALVKQLEETGRVAEAQGIILDALEESYAGAAGAARDTFGGALTALRNTIDSAMTGGTGSIAGATSAINALNDALSSPQGKKAVEALTVAVGGLATVMAGRLVASLVTSTAAVGSLAAAKNLWSAATAKATFQTNAMGQVISVTTSKMALMTAASRAASAGMALLGGPVGAVVLAATALTYFATRASDAEKESAELDRRINELGTSFEGLSKKGAEAAIVNYQNKVKLLKEESIEAGKETLKWHRYLADAPDGAWADQYRDNITLARDAQEKLSSKILDTEQKITQLKAIANGDPLGGLSSSAAVASSTFEKMNQQIQEQILQLNNRTGAALLAARAEAGYVKDLQDGELELLLVGERQLDALKDKIAAQNKAASAAESSAKSQRSAAESQLKSIRDNVAALEKQAAQLGMTAEAIKLVDLAAQGATESQLKQAKAALEVVDAYEKQQAYKDLVADLRTEEEKLTDQVRERLKVLDAIKGLSDEDRNKTRERIVDAGFSKAPEFSGISPEIGGPAGELIKIDKEAEKLEEWYAKQLEMLEEHRSNEADLTAEWDAKEQSLKRDHEAKLAEIEQARTMARMAAGEEFFGNMSGLTKTFFGEQSTAYRAAFALEKSYALAKVLMNAPKTASDAYQAMAGIPVVGPALGVAAAGAALAYQAVQASGISSINLSGMAHDGIDSIPEDGTWLLQKGERVTTAGTSDKLDRTLEQIRQGQQAGGGNMQFALTIYADGKEQGQAPQELSALVNGIKRIVQEELITAKRPGGLLNE